VSKAKSVAGKKNPYISAVKSARKKLGVQGFVPIGGQTPKGKFLKTFVDKGHARRKQAAAAGSS
jgi:hypothetical protein